MAVSRLLHSHSDAYATILEELSSRRPRLMSARFVGVIDQFRQRWSGHKTNVHSLARAAMTFFPSNDLHDFVIQLINNDIFRISRLHTISNLRYFNIDAVILLDNVLGDAHDGDMVEIVARNFAESEVIRVMRMASYYVDDVRGILAEMRRSEVFSRHYNPAGAAERWTVSRIWKFILLLHRKTGAPIPSSTNPLHVRFTVEEALKAYFHGEIEVMDFASHVTALCGDNTELFAEAVRRVSAQSTPLGQFMTRRQGR